MSQSQEVLDSMGAESIRDEVIALTHADGIPVPQIAQKAGVSESTVYGWRSGDQVPSGPQLLRLAQGMLQHGNTRLLDLMLTEEWSLTRSDLRRLLDGSIHDDLSEMRMETADAIRADKAGNDRKTLQELRDAKDQLENAIAEVRARLAKLTSDTPAPAGDGAPSAAS
jgi:transcriptional regulator with XRE-family HTH domain